MSDCNLRPHHALCAGFFRGKGYSEVFVENMSAVVGTLRGSDPLLTLRGAADPICGACPHNCGGVCGHADKVKGYDAAVLSLLGLQEGAEVRWSELAAQVRQRIFHPGRVKEVCGGCQWYGICEKEEYQQ